MSRGYIKPDPQTMISKQNLKRIKLYLKTWGTEEDSEGWEGLSFTETVQLIKEINQALKENK